MRYLEELYKQYKEQKKNPLPDLIDLPDIEKEKVDKIFNDIKQNIIEKKEYEKPDFEFGEIYYFIDNKNIPIFFMIDSKIEDTNLYSVYKVSDFVDFATQNDFIFDINDLPYMVETWNEFYLTEEEIEKALYIGKLSDDDLDILEKVLDESFEIPENRRGLTIPEEGNYIQNKFKEDEVEDLKEYKIRIFSVFEEIEKKREIEFLNELLYKSLQEQEENIEFPELAYAAQEQSYAEGNNFAMIKEKDELIVKVTNKNLIGKKGKITIFGKTIEGTIPETFKIKIPEKLQKVSIEFIADNLKIEAED